MLKRKDNRLPNQIRQVKIQRNYIKNCESSCLIEIGNTKLICTATLENKVPYFLKNQNYGWLHAEYGMLPRSCKERVQRERTSGRIYEIQRIIGRALRSIIDLETLNHWTITIDCDVIQADGGTRTAAITGGYIVLYDLIEYMRSLGIIKYSPIKEAIAAISVGIVDKEPMLDLTYEEDQRAAVDMNIAMTESTKIVEIQGTGEKRAFTIDEFNKLIELAKIGIKELIKIQNDVLSNV